VWEKVFKHLAQDADNEYAMIDATIVRAHQHSAGAKNSSAEKEDIADIPQVAATHRVINLNYSIHGVLKQINAI
jgi:hypothetical protein